MVRTIGPAVGAKAQLGYKEEGKWGYPNFPPTKFLDLTSEGVVSEYTNLISASLRSDRAVHKQRTGTETAGGDINFELAPQGYDTFIKHALGQKRTKRRDIAVVVLYEGADTDRFMTLTSAAISTTGTTVGDDFSINITDGMTVQQLLSAIRAETNFEAYAPWGDGTDGTSGGYYAQALATKLSAGHSLGASDFDSAALAKTAAGVTNLETFSDMFIAPDASSNGLTAFPIYFKYGVYEHVIDAAPTLPEGISIEIGRDVAAFNYYGAKVNTMSMTLNPGEIVTGTFNVMARGASTVSDPAVSGTNTGWAAPICALRYAGSQESAKVTFNMDGSTDSFYFEHGASASEVTTYHFTLLRPYITHDGYYFDTSILNGFLEFLEYESDYFAVSRKAGWDTYGASSTIADITETAITAIADLNITAAVSATIVPFVRGNYIGTDGGQSQTLYIDITTAGSTDGTAAFKGSWTGSSWSAATVIQNNVWADVLDENGIDTGFDVMWPEIVDLASGDTWTIETFKVANTGVVYATEDPYTGFQGAVTLDRGDGAGSVSQGVMGCTFTLNNNIFGDKFELGDRQRAAVVAQKRTTEGSLNMEFDDLDIYRMFVNGTAGDLSISMTSDEYINNSTTKYSMTLRFPNIKFSGTTPVAGGEDIITTDFPFNSLYDDVNDIPDLRITIVNGLNYV